MTTEMQSNDASKKLESITPLVNEIYSHGALHAIRNGVNNIIELFFYLLGLACIAFSFIMSTTFPFHVLGDIMDKRIYEQAATGKGDIELFALAVRALVIIIGLLFICIGILIRKAGKRRSLLQAAGKELKSIEQYFKEVHSQYKPSDKTKEQELPKINTPTFPNVI